MLRAMSYSIVALLVLASANAAAFQNEPEGFRSINWETPIENVQDQLQLFEEASPTKFYRRKIDKLSIGGAKLEKITYAFYKGKFEGVLIHTEPGADNKRALIAAFREQYGPGSKTNQFMEQYIWPGAIATAYINCPPVQDFCTAVITSTAVANQKRREESAAAKSAKKDF